ncbi:MAG TPA: LacI family DNA-binding transcriptional regulator [Chloroflexota bacterium]
MATDKRQREPGAGRITIQDVAELAGVSIATVSRVLNSHPDVSPVTRAEVLKHVHETGYVSNRMVDLRPNARVRLIGLAVPELRGDYVTEIVAAATETLHDQGARLVICSDRRNGRSVPLRERLLPGTTDGALLILPSDSDEDLKALQESEYPFVVIEPTMSIDEGIPAVAATNWAGAKMAAEHLIGLGHTHIGVISGPATWRVSEERLAGYHAALLAAGLPLSSRLVQSADEATIAGGRMAAEQLLSLAHVPTAIIALNDVMAVGVLAAARARGLEVPDDLSVVGFDDIEMASITTPPLTTVQQPLQGLGRVGANVLWRLLEGQELDATRIELSTRLIVRESTAPPRGGSFMTV